MNMTEKMTTLLLALVFITCFFGARLIVNTMDMTHGINPTPIDVQSSIDPWNEPFYLGFTMGAGHMCNWDLDTSYAYAAQHRIEDFGSYLIGKYGYEAWDAWSTANGAEYEIDGYEDQEEY